jgi:hypothetical protein
VNIDEKWPVAQTLQTKASLIKRKRRYLIQISHIMRLNPLDHRLNSCDQLEEFTIKFGPNYFELNNIAALFVSITN